MQAQIKFKNVLDIPEQFNFAVDNPSFILTKKFEKINKKAVANITVAFKPVDGSGGGKGNKSGKAGNKSSKGAKPEAKEAKPAPGANIGKLLVTCPAVKNASWLFYLQGE